MFGGATPQKAGHGRLGVEFMGETTPVIVLSILIWIKIHNIVKRLFV
jgi:hypothetical protein